MSHGSAVIGDDPRAPNSDARSRKNHDHPVKACHNCRRRRLRCDRSLPRCLKCASLGQECQGYGKLFVWTHAVASRGKMTGRSSFAPSTPTPTPGVPSSSPATAFSRLTGQNAPPGSLTPADEQLGLVLAWMPPSRSLVDPLLQDLDPSSRRYLYHFAFRLCIDIAPFDPPGRNAFVDMLPMARENGFLMHNLVGISAMHLSKITRFTAGESYWTRKVMIDALAAKQRAISELTVALDGRANDGGGSSSKRDAILAALVFFVNFDLVDSGKETWRLHLEMAGRLIEEFERSGGGGGGHGRPAGTVAPSPVQNLLDNLLSMCVAYYIFGSTLTTMTHDPAAAAAAAHPAPRAASAFDRLDVVAALRRTETSNYHSCPAEVLHAMLLVSRLAGRAPGLPRERVVAEASAIVGRLVGFDVEAWAAALPGITDPKEVRDRTHVALTYRSATYLYTLLALPLEGVLRFSDGLTVEDVFTDIKFHTLSLEDGSGFFKALTWPLFMAGAAVLKPEQRQWAKEMLLRILEELPWGFLMTALEALDVIWELRDTVAGREQTTEWNWLDEFRKLKIDALIV